MHIQNQVRVINRRSYLFTALTRMALAVVLLVMCSCFFISSAKADPLYQTIPTMPPPSSTPTVTSTVVIQPTQTHFNPSPTSPQATHLPPTQTAEAVATRTAVATNTSTPTQALKPPTLVLSQATLGGTITQAASLSSSATAAQGQATAIQPSSEVGGSNLSWIGLVGGGVFLVLLILYAAWRSSRKKTDDQASGTKSR
jgi:hypothetical protein